MIIYLESCLTHNINIIQDAPTAGAGKHIVFGSDDDDEDDGETEDNQQATSEVTASKKALLATGNKAAANEDKTIKEKVSEESLDLRENYVISVNACIYSSSFMCVQVKPSVPQLFSGSEDEEDGDDEEEDDSRFDIRPQFEGRAGQKVRKGVDTVRLHTLTCLHILFELYNIPVQINAVIPDHIVS